MHSSLSLAVEEADPNPAVLIGLPLMRHAQLIMQTVCLSISRTLCSSSFRLWKKRGFFNVPGAKAALQLLPHRAMTSPSSKIEVTAKVLHL